MPVYTADNNALNIVGTIKVNIKWGNVERAIICYIVKGFKYDLLLGTNVFAQFEPVISWTPYKIIRFKDGSQAEFLTTTGGNK